MIGSGYKQTLGRVFGNVCIQALSRQTQGQRIECPLNAQKRTHQFIADVVAL